MLEKISQQRDLDGSLYDLISVYFTKIFPKISHLRGATRLKYFLGKFFIRLSNGKYAFKASNELIELKGEDSVNPITNEAPFVNYILENKNSIENFIDVGAYTGFYSVLVSKVSQAEVKCFEPNKKNLETIKANKETNNVQFNTIQRVVWDSKTELDFNSDRGKSNVVQNRKAFSKQSVTLDGFIDDDNIDLLKIDVEGAELKVIKGAESLIQKHRPVILLELHKSERLEGFGYDSRDVINFLKELEYSIENKMHNNYDDLIIARPD